MFTLAGVCLGMILLGCADPSTDRSNQSSAAIDWSDWPDLQSREKEEVKQCLQGSAERDGAHQPGNTPLHCAAWIGAADVIATLLDAGADVHARNDGGRSPLHYAIQGSMVKKDRAGIPMGPYARHSRDATRAKTAIEGDYVPVISLLAHAGANLDLHDESGVTPLHDSLFGCQFDLAQALVKAGADVRIPRRKYTPLHTAALEGCAEAVPLLIKAGAKVNPQEISGTPLHFAIDRSGDPETVAALLRHGANVNAKGGYYGTPLDLALRNRNLYLEFLAEKSDEGYRQRIRDEDRRRRMEKMIVDYETIISMIAAAGGKTSESLLREREAGAVER